MMVASDLLKMPLSGRSSFWRYHLSFGFVASLARAAVGS